MVLNSMLAWSIGPRGLADSTRINLSRPTRKHRRDLVDSKIPSVALVAVTVSRSGVDEADLVDAAVVPANVRVELALRLVLGGLVALVVISVIGHNGSLDELLLGLDLHGQIAIRPADEILELDAHLLRQ